MYSEFLYEVNEIWNWLAKPIEPGDLQRSLEKVRESEAKSNVVIGL